MPADLPLTVEPYRDRKRLAWLLSLAVPLTIAAGPVLWLWHPVTAMLWLPVAFSYAIAPLLDWALGTDASNPPESAVPRPGKHPALTPRPRPPGAEHISPALTSPPR